MFSLNFTGVKVFALSALGVTLVPYICRWSLCNSYHPIWSIVYYMCCYNLFIEGGRITLQTLSMLVWLLLEYKARNE